MQLDNLMIGHNIARYRRMKDIKAHDLAERLGMKEATYTEYERGETAITIDFLQKVAEALKANPLYLLSASPGNVLESINHSSIAIQDNSTFQTANEQTNMMLKVMENVVALNERMVALLESRRQ